MAYGYQGDATADSKSLAGVGDRDNHLSSGSDHQSVALTIEGRMQRFGLNREDAQKSTGKPFEQNGKTFYDEDTAPTDFVFNGQQRHNSPDLVDVFDPHHPPDVGVGRNNPTSPYNFGYRVASPDDVSHYDNYVKAGGDPNKLEDATLLGVALAKNPAFLLQDPKMFYHFVTEPMNRQSLSSQITNGLASLPGATGQMLGDLWNGAVSVAGTAPSLGKYLFSKFSGIDDPQAARDLAQHVANNTEGATQALRDVPTMLDAAQATLREWTRPIAEAFVSDPQQRQQIDFQYSEILRNQLQRQYQIGQWGKGMQDTAANVYKTLGMADVADQLKQVSADPSAVRGIAMGANPLNFIPVGAGERAVSAVIPSFFERGLNAARTTAEAVAEEGATKAATLIPPGTLKVNGPLTNSDVMKVVSQGIPLAQKASDAVKVATGDLTNSQQLIGKYLNASNGVGSYVTGKVAQLGGDAIQGTGNAMSFINKIPDMLADRLVPGNPELRSHVAEVFKWITAGAAGSVFDAAAGGAHPFLSFLGGDLAYLGLKMSPDVIKGIGGFLSTAGRELTYGRTTLPYWQRVAQQLDGLPKGIASALDNPLVYAAGSAIKGGVAGMGAGSVMGALTSPGHSIEGAMMGAVQGGLFGVAGGGFGQVKKFTTPAEFMAESRGDWKRYRDMLPQAERLNFDKLSSPDQLALSQFSHQFPGLKVNYFSDPNGAWGIHQGDTVHINTAVPGSAIRGTLAHEFSHSIAENGQLPALYDELLGNPATGKAGQYTGTKEIDPTTGRYQTNAEFANLKNQYINKLAAANLPSSHLDDLDISKEIYAEHGADYALSGQHMVDAWSAARPGWFNNQFAMKQALMKLGAAFDRDGNIVRGTGLFNDLRRNETLDKMVGSYYHTKFAERSFNHEDIPDRGFTLDDLKRNPNIVNHWFDSSPDVLRDKDGNVQTDATGAPILRSPKEVKKYNAGLANDIRDFINGLPEDRRAAMGFEKRGENNYFMRYMPDELLEHLAQKNQYNPTQIANLKNISRQLADLGQSGREWRFFHQTATKGGKYTQLAGAEKHVVPYGIEATNDGNVVVKGVDFRQLTNNYLKYRDKNSSIRDLWKVPNDFHEDVKTYFANHAGGRPGAEGIGTQKRDVINALSGLGEVKANKEMNPFTSQVPKARSIIKSYRLDRMNRVTPTDNITDFKGEAQYHQYLKPNYLPKVEFQEGMKGAEDLKGLHEDLKKIYKEIPDWTVPVKENQMFADARGFYNEYTGKLKGPGEIGINPDHTQIINDRRLAYIHELMHAQDHQSLGDRVTLGSKEWMSGKIDDEEIGKFLNSVKSTSTYQNTLAMAHPSHPQRQFGKYLIQPEEVVARAMTQHAVKNLPGEKYLDLKLKVRDERSKTYGNALWWTDKEMSDTISPAVERLIEAKGLKP